MLKHISDSWSDFKLLILSFVENDKVRSVLEIGAGANPFISDKEVHIFNINYTILDVDADELNKAQNHDAIRIIHDLSESNLPEKYDLIFSHMLLEHLPKPKEFHKNIILMMHAESVVCHFYATKYGLPSLLNLILPNRISNYIIYNLQRRDPKDEGKFPAYYRKCTGPLKSNTYWFESLGYLLKTYNGYLGHSYLGRITWLNKIEQFYCNCIRKVKSPYLTSNAILVMTKNKSSFR